MGKINLPEGVQNAAAQGAKAFNDGAKAVRKAMLPVEKGIGDATDKLVSAAGDVRDKAFGAANIARDSVVGALDLNGDGNLDIEDVIILGLRVPSIRIQRSDFLRAEFMKRYPKETIDDAIAHTPAHAGIPRADIDRIADDVISFERNCAAGISAALGVPGGAAMAATIPADIVQYYAYMLRAAQKLMYLYGFPEIDTCEKGQSFDSETINLLTICLGVMFGVAGANKAIRAFAGALANGMEKKLLRAALTKGTIYPIVKRVFNFFQVKMTKEVFAGFFKKAIPAVGGVIGGTLTYVSFKPCCDKLKASLRETMLANPEQAITPEEERIIAELRDEVSDAPDDEADAEPAGNEPEDGEESD